MTHVSNRSHVPDFLLSVGAVVEFDAHSDALDGDIVVFDGVDGSSSLEWMKSYMPGKVGWMDTLTTSNAQGRSRRNAWVRFSGPSRPSMP